MNVKKNSVLLVGASVRWAAQSAARAGYRVIGMDLFGDLDTRAACARFHRLTSQERSTTAQLELAIGQLARQEQATVFRVGGLPPTSHPCSTDDSAPLEFASTPCPPPSHSSPISLSDLQRLAQASGFRCPETRFPTPGDLPRSGRWLLKELDCTGGLGVRFFDPSRPIAPTAYLQRWIPGRACGLVALASHEGVRLLGMTRAIHCRLGTLPFVYAGSRTSGELAGVPWRQMHALAAQIAAQRGLCGLFNLDWICDRQNRWWLLEVNERPSGSCEVLERLAVATRMRGESSSLMHMHISAMDASVPVVWPAIESLAACRRQNSRHIKRIVYSRRDGQVCCSSLPAAWQEDANAVPQPGAGTQLHVADRPAEGTRVKRGQPIATLLVQSTASISAIARTVRDAVRVVQASVS